MPGLRLRVEEWVLPSHTQAMRVAGGRLDLAIAWMEAVDMEQHHLAADLLWYEALEALRTTLASRRRKKGARRAADGESVQG